jgi:hypothetical protein
MSDTNYTREAVEAAWARAYGEAENIAGDDMAFDAMGALDLAGYLPEGAGSVTSEEAASAYNDLADAAKLRYNPDEGENGDTIRSDSCGDLVVNLAAGFLADPEAEVAGVIAAAWEDLDPGDGPADPGPERDAAIVAEVTGWF